MQEPRQILVESADRVRSTRSSAKWHTYDPDVLPLWVAEMDARPVPAVVEVVTRAMADGDTGYYPRSTPYAASVARFAADRWGWSFDPTTAAPVADVMTGVSALLRELTDEGGPVVVSPPVYDAFPTYLASIHRRQVDAPLTPEGRLDLAALDRTFAEVTAGGVRAAYLLCSPQNPTGTVHTPAELRALAGAADRHGVRVVADEIHAPLVQPGTPFTPYAVADPTGRGLSVLSASKGWNLAGLKAALVVPGAALERVPLPEAVTHGASHLGLLAQTAALDHGREWLDRLLVEVADNARLLTDLLAEHAPDVGYVEPPATYLAWLDLRGTGLGDDPAKVLLKQGRVALGSGPRYGLAGHARLNLAASPEVVEEAVRRIGAVVAPAAARRA